MIFFSIFAVIFGSRDAASSTPKIKVAISCESDSKLARRSIEHLAKQQTLRISDRKKSPSKASEPLDSKNVDRATAEDLVRRGIVSAAIVFTVPKNSENNSQLPSIEILTDSFDQVASQVLTAIVQKSVMTANAELVKEASVTEQVSVVLPSSTRGETAFPGSGPVSNAVYNSASNSSAKFPQPPLIETIDVIGGKKTNPVVTMYAAGIAVMFLLFSATTASGSLLEERENSTLDRLLCSRLTMDQLLLGKWAYMTMIGTTQMTLMFLWGALVFRIDLWNHLEGFAAMTLVTAGAAASFALMLASLCKSRMQLGWISTIMILSMSALGGSMVPRYLMSETVQRAGLLTFNAWALEGYNKVFWRELPLADLSRELAVLTACGFLFIVAARIFAVRWERT